MPIETAAMEMICAIRIFMINARLLIIDVGSTCVGCHVLTFARSGTELCEPNMPWFETPIPLVPDLIAQNGRWPWS
ncbi:MAG TPA: hypothetical protein VK251_07940 [Steroidobacteraceae bacterium]|nr:hypothetical protein [Steroidobacteraceae bacterium]